MYSDNGLGCCGPSSGGLGAWWSFLPQAWDIAKGFIPGGGSGGTNVCWQYDEKPLSAPCPGTPNIDAVARAVQAAPDSRIAELSRRLKIGNRGRGPTTRAEFANPRCMPYWINAMMGGRDCYPSKQPDNPEVLMAFVRAYGAPTSPQDGIPGSSFTPGFGSTNLAPLVAGGMALVFLPKLFGKGR